LLLKAHPGQDRRTGLPALYRTSVLSRTVAEACTGTGTTYLTTGHARCCCLLARKISYWTGPVALTEGSSTFSGAVSPLHCDAIMPLLQLRVDESVLQTEVKSRRAQDAVRGTVKVSVLRDDPSCPDLLAVSVYDTKPVHMLSTVADCVEWIKKERKVWSTSMCATKTIEFLRLNVIEMYNAGMGSVDVADQLRNSYRPDVFMRKQKWWWAILFWALGVAETNAWKLYDSVHCSARTPGAQRLNHFQFIALLAKQMVWPHEYYPPAMKKRARASPVHHVGRGARAKNAAAAKSRPQQVATLNHNSMTNGFPDRLDGRFHSIESTTNKSSACQFCLYKLKRDYPSDYVGPHSKTLPKNCKNILKCLTCNVRLCVTCFNEFHTIP
jgi:hypothetical protein